MFLLDKIAEARIQEAADRGELENLPGSGQTLCLDDDRHIPAELRVAYRILKNAGYVPMEIQLRKEISQVEQLLVGINDAAEKNRISKKLNLLMTRLSLSRGSTVDLRVEAAYFEKLRNKIQKE